MWTRQDKTLSAGNGELGFPGCLQVGKPEDERALAEGDLSPDMCRQSFDLFVAQPVQTVFICLRRAAWGFERDRELERAISQMLAVDEDCAVVRGVGYGASQEPLQATFRYAAVRHDDPIGRRCGLLNLDAPQGGVPLQRVNGAFDQVLAVRCPDGWRDHRFGAGIFKNFADEAMQMMACGLNFADTGSVVVIDRP